jgi:hypothetical protein
MATGNYNFFNLLTLALCLVLVDDTFLRRFLPQRFCDMAVVTPNHRKPWNVRFWFLLTIAIPVVTLNLLQMTITLREDRRSRGIDTETLPAPVKKLVEINRRFHFVSTYGLFRSMTTRRREIIIEGSNDRREWKAYEFKWKPGDLSQRPQQVAPHQPRLDWQMWFAALGNYRQRHNQWFVGLERRILEGSPEVLALFQKNPFPDNPPRFIRAELYDYHFSDWNTLREDDIWWTRERIGRYTPVLSLDSFRR